MHRSCTVGIPSIRMSPSASVSLPASLDWEHRFPPTASPESFPSAPEDDSPVPSFASGRSLLPLDCVLPLLRPAHSSRPSPLLPSAARTSLSFRKFAQRCLKSIAFGPPRLHRFCLRHSRGGYRSCRSPRLGSLCTVPVPSLAPFFGSSALRSTGITRLPRYYGLCCLLLHSRRGDLPR